MFPCQTKLTCSRIFYFCYYFSSFKKLPSLRYYKIKSKKFHVTLLNKLLLLNLKIEACFFIRFFQSSSNLNNIFTVIICTKLAHFLSSLFFHFVDCIFYHRKLWINTISSHQTKSTKKYIFNKLLCTLFAEGNKYMKKKISIKNSKFNTLLQHKNEQQESFE